MLQNKLFITLILIVPNLIFSNVIENILIDFQFGGAFEGHSKYHMYWESSEKYKEYNSTLCYPYKVSLKMGYIFKKILLAPIIKSEIKFDKTKGTSATERIFGFSLFGGFSELLKFGYSYIFLDVCFGYSSDTYWIDHRSFDDYKCEFKVPIFQVCPGIQLKLFKNIDLSLAYNFNVLFGSDISEIKNNTLHEVNFNKIRHDVSFGIVFLKFHK